MLVEDRASVEAALDERDPSRLRIDIRVHPVGGGSFSAEAGEIQRLILDGFRDALREAQLDRLMLTTNPQPKRKGWLGRALTFVVCAGLGAVATIALSAYHPHPGAIASVDELGSPEAAPGSQSNSVPPSPEVAPPQTLGSAGAAESEPGPGTFGLHQQ
ncbi:MAG: hypothetical protein JOY52_07510 [Hyphomicrobiales bacterium]|nr:hypothetical protein [Hyphomicrobiales bacterium]